MFPDVLSIEHLVKPADRYKAVDAEDENASLERISHYKVLKAAQPYIGREPAIPVTYLLHPGERFRPRPARMARPSSHPGVSSG